MLILIFIDTTTTIFPSLPAVRDTRNAKLPTHPVIQVLNTMQLSVRPTTEASLCACT
jgi:hypothetical protein